jgi:hypothetical protein
MEGVEVGRRKVERGDQDEARQERKLKDTQ